MPEIPETCMFRERAELTIQKTGQRLERLVREGKVTVAELAAMVGIPKSNIYRFLAGKGGLGARPYFALCLWMKESGLKTDAEIHGRPHEDEILI